MIGLFLLAMAVVVGHSVLTKLGLIKDSNISAPAANKLPVPQSLSEDDYYQRIREWRAKWEPLVDRTKWIPSGTAERILEQYPAPSRSTDSAINKLLNRNPALAELRLACPHRVVRFQS